MGIEGRGHGELQRLGQMAEGFHHAGDADAAAGQQDRTLRLTQQTEQPVDLGSDVSRCGQIRLEAREGGRIHQRPLDVRRDIDPDGAGPPSQGEVKGLLQVEADVLRPLHQGGVFGEGAHHRYNVDLLVPQLAQPAGACGSHEGLALHLAADDNQAQAVCPGPVDPRQRVQATRSRGHIHRCEAPAVAEIALGSNGAGLLMVEAGDRQVGVATERIVEMHGPATRDQEDVLQSMFSQGLGDVVSDTDHGASEEQRLEVAELANRDGDQTRTERKGDKSKLNVNGKALAAARSLPRLTGTWRGVPAVPWDSGRPASWEHPGRASPARTGQDGTPAEPARVPSGLWT